MKIIMIGGIFPPEQYDTIIDSSLGVIDFAADTLQKSIIHGLSYHMPNDISLLNLPFIGSYPSGYKQLFDPSYDFDFKTAYGSVKGYNVGFCNLSGYKVYSRYIHLKYHDVLKQVSQSDEDVVLFIYSTTIPPVQACVDCKKKNPNVKIVCLVTDLPEYMSTKKNLIRDIYKKTEAALLKDCYKSVDGWVLLSQHMTERLPVRENNWVVMEGIYNGIIDDNVGGEVSKERYILYSGTLAERYGIQTLVRAFHNSKLADVKLYICGAGDSQKMIENYCQKDDRIKYIGQLRREEVLKLQKGATLLVNPRTPEGEFTKYSFPSKTMEYMASGVPMLMYRLQGIPTEYFKHCYVVETVGEKSLTEALEGVLSKSTEELSRVGRNAREFILSQKNPISQMGKVVEFIKSL